MDNKHPIYTAPERTPGTSVPWQGKSMSSMQNKGHICWVVCGVHGDRVVCGKSTMGIVCGRCALELGFDALRFQDQIEES